MPPQVTITLLYAGIMGLLLLILSFNVMQNWVSVTGRGRETDRGLRRAERLLSSFVEYVPMSLFLMLLIEMRHAQPFILHCLGVTLVTARILHAYGSNDIRGSDFLRFVGAQLTFLMIAFASMACIFYYAIGLL